MKIECDYLFGKTKKTVTYAKLSPKMVNLRDIAGNADEEVVAVMCLCVYVWCIYFVWIWISIFVCDIFLSDAYVCVFVCMLCALYINMIFAFSTCMFILSFFPCSLLS